MNYYNKKYFEERDTLDLIIAEAIKIFMSNHKLKKVLDVGCGTGKLVHFLNDSGSFAIGCDLYQEAIKVAKQKNKKSTFVKASATKLPFKNDSFDLLTAISLVEHLTKKEVETFLSEASRIVRPKGYIFLVTPNFNSPMRFLFRRRWFGYSDPTHITFFTPRSLGKLLQRHGFHDIKLWFKTNSNGEYTRLSAIPSFLRRNVIYLLFSTRFYFLRDSFWISGKNTKYLLG